MMVYQMKVGYTDSFVKRIADNPYEAIEMASRLRQCESRFRRRDLIAYGMSSRDIERMLESGFLVEVEVSREDALSIAGYHKFHTDPEYETMVLQSLMKARKCLDVEKLRENVKIARRKRHVTMRSRRNNLLKRVIIPEFGKQNKDGSYSPPEEVSVVEVVKALQKYPRLSLSYPRGVYASVWLDIHNLGIKIKDKHETRVKTWKEKFETYPDFASSARNRALHATEVRLSLYEENPEIEEAAHKASAKTRKKKMQDDHEFRSATLSRLAKGNDALWQKYRTDREFRENMREKQIAGLAKGHKTMKKRVKERRQALRHLAERKFGGLDNVSASMLVQYIEDNRPKFRTKYYRDYSLGILIKRDLHYIRTEM